MFCEVSNRINVSDCRLFLKSAGADKNVAMGLVRTVITLCATF